MVTKRPPARPRTRAPLRDPANSGVAAATDPHGNALDIAPNLDQGATQQLQTLERRVEFGNFLKRFDALDRDAPFAAGEVGEEFLFLGAAGGGLVEILHEAGD